MLYTEEIFELEDSIDRLCDCLLASSPTRGYLKSRQLIETSKITQEHVKDFSRAKESFEKIEAYGQYAPDYKEKRRALRATKRQLDMDNNIVEFRIYERDVQESLDLVTYEIAQSISSNIKIEAGNPFFEFAQKGCGGNCHVG
ncbi:YlbF family regulator [Vagococcus intermedius]|uniref:YlbF family regulator n=1 Tax=Vagococcus intermedius TaxID=2991418 RepID=A0AAF0CTV9_9ENTE|nr:YlbF family regulator [Vagococcus intermedius]WEG72895.1 YlbF family regulator [Vagococcus intermedius]WEG74982.1 YlbF family regulator [Vagococcus intermedius]